MLLNKIFKNLEIIFDKDEYGGSLEVDEFNEIIAWYQEAFVREKYEDYLVRGLNRREIFATKIMRSLTKKADISFTGGIGDVPDDFLYEIDGWSSGNYRIDILPNEIWSRRKTSVLTGPLTTHPIVRFYENKIEILPADVTTVNAVYVKTPTTAFLDYYIDDEDNKVYLAAGATGVSVPAGGSTRTGTLGPVSVDSSTVELEIDKSFHGEFMNRISDIVAARMRDLVGKQHTELKIQQDKEI